MSKLGIGLLAGGLAVLLWPRRASAADSSKLSAVIPSQAQAYWTDILEVSTEKGVDPLLTVAIGDRESQWGTSPNLTEQGPAGKSKDGADLGLMQLNSTAQAAALQKIDWTNPRQNIGLALDILKANLRLFSKQSRLATALNGQPYVIADGGKVFYTSVAQAQKFGLIPQGTTPTLPGPYFMDDPRPLSGTALTAAAVAAYNTGATNVLRALAAGKPADFTTAGGDYSSDILLRRSMMVATLSS